MLKGVQNFVSSIPYKMKLFKVKYSEANAIRKKRPIYENVVWNDEQQKEFDDFWLENYGKKIKPYWNKLYEASNGVFHKDYFPEMLYSTVLEPVLAPEKYCIPLENKSMLRSFYGNTVKLPETVIDCRNGNYTDGNGELLSKIKVLEIFNNAGKCIIKPTVETGSGKGVCVLNMQNGIDIETNKKSEDILNEHGKNFTVQNKVRNSRFFEDIYPYSLNTVRLITYIVNSEIHNVTPVMRIGVGGNMVDNIHMGGLCIGINENGMLKERAYQLGYGDKTTVFTKHPDTGIVFKGYYAGEIKKMIEIAKKLHSETPYVDMISWDLTFDDNDDVVLIEANCSGQSVWFPQIVNEEPLFGNDTAYMIKKMCDKK